ncbi:DoxX family protein [Polaribacter sargassicola]|uniref:DoxX family protein n=1 Tax=Polaribacter sargassicola TaxID=2836891 RepID=UPI001F34FFC4|nr:DoxX family protein [Polaribacter sp. DS7-9]MCG1037665.1 DoxX family protein [Polaribacter sp. DS7-9]
MNNLTKFDQFYLEIRSNRWYWYFSIFCRIILAYAFIVAGIVKIMDEKFANGLSEIHPMGAYLTALHHTGYYYPFIGFAQIIAAILLLIPRTVTLGALLYFPIIVNICILSLALRFEGSFVTAPLMVLANLYILIWNYDRLKYILPFKQTPIYGILKKPEKYNNKFPFLFFIGVIITFVLIILIFLKGFDIMPRNSISDCKKQYINTKYETIGNEFCLCVHSKNTILDTCLEDFSKKKKQLDKNRKYNYLFFDDIK